MGARLTRVFGAAVKAGRRRAPADRAPRPVSPAQAREQPLQVWAPSLGSGLSRVSRLLGWGLIRGRPTACLRSSGVLSTELT